MMKTIYLDYAAATPLDPDVLTAMEPYFAQKFHNPSSSYLAAREVRQKLEEARAKTAACLGAKPAEVVFTAGATEANNLAIQGVMRAYPNSEVLVGAIEHESVLEPAKLFKCRKVPVDTEGHVILNKLSNLINANTVLLSLAYVNNEIGTVQQLSKIAAIVSEIRRNRRRQKTPLPIYLHSDAAQAPNCFDIHVSRLGVDLLSINGGKIYGPKQSGVLYVRARTKLSPLILGGGQEFNLRSGTENVPAAIGLATALAKAQAKRKHENGRIEDLRRLLIAGMQRAQNGSVVNGSKKHNAPHILSVSFPGVDNEHLMMQLDESGIQVATGSACAASSSDPSHVLAAIGLSDKDARSTLRFSLGRQTTKSEIKQVVKVLDKLLS